MNLIPFPPSEPCNKWLEGFAAAMIELRPGLPPANAACCARLAHAGTWLMDSDEAAHWWHLAVNAAASEIGIATGKAAGSDPRVP